MIYFEIFVEGLRFSLSFHFFLCGYLIVRTPFVENCLFSIELPFILAKNQLALFGWSLSLVFPVSLRFLFLVF